VLLGMGAGYALLLAQQDQQGQQHHDQMRVHSPPERQ
jgi:hypothetical protein